VERCPLVEGEQDGAVRVEFLNRWGKTTVQYDKNFFTVET
jgi:hypothetical protein